ncbi:MAG: hypothetical protein ABFD79_09545 [Phycisphaerales bacterium]
MKKLTILFVMAAMVNFMLVGVSKAADPNKPNRPMFDPNAIRGKVEVVKDANGTITSMKILNKRRGDWNVVLNDKAKELAQELEGRIVEITGTQETKDGQKWVTIESYKQMRRPEPRRGYGDPNQMPRRPERPGRGPAEGNQ